MNIGDRIKARRLELGMTLEDVGKLVGVGKSTVRKWETGMIRNMGRDKISLLADALNLPPTDFIFIEDQSTIHSLSSAEIQLITKYRFIDERGRANVDRILEWEYQDAIKRSPSGRSPNRLRLEDNPQEEDRT